MLIDELTERLDADQGADDEASHRQIATLVKEIESVLTVGRQLFPNSTHLATSAAKLATVLENHPRALQILNASFQQNQHNSFVAIRLSKQLERQGSAGREQAVTVLRKAIALSARNKDLHYSLARLLRALGEEANSVEIGQHLKKSFTEGDNRYEARFYYARHLYIYGDRNMARREFQVLAVLPMSPKQLNEIGGFIQTSTGDKLVFRGTVAKLNAGYGFISVPQLNETIFTHAKGAPAFWRQLTVRTEVELFVGFNFKGPCAVVTRVL